MRALELLGTVAPGPTAAIAWRLFWNLGTPERVHPRDAAVHARARRSELVYGARRVAVYEWGEGPVVLLVHGWRSRASRLSAIVEALAQDHTVVAFDAPGNGDSPGERTTALEYAAIVAMLSDRYGGFETLVAHSIGVIASVMAIRDLGADTGSLVTVAGMHDFDHVIESFGRQAGLPKGVLERFRERFVEWGQPIMGDVDRRLLTELPPDRQLPMLVVHDRSDREVHVEQAERIAAAHPGAELLLTDGLGHARILRDPAVVDAIAAFTRRVTTPVL